MSSGPLPVFEAHGPVAFTAPPPSTRQAPQPSDSVPRWADAIVAVTTMSAAARSKVFFIVASSRSRNKGEERSVTVHRELIGFRTPPPFATEFFLAYYETTGRAPACWPSYDQRSRG